MYLSEGIFGAICFLLHSTLPAASLRPGIQMILGRKWSREVDTSRVYRNTQTTSATTAIVLKHTPVAKTASSSSRPLPASCRSAPGRRPRSIPTFSLRWRFRAFPLRLLFLVFFDYCGVVRVLAAATSFARALRKLETWLLRFWDRRCLRWFPILRLSSRFGLRLSASLVLGKWDHRHCRTRLRRHLVGIDQRR